MQLSISLGPTILILFRNEQAENYYLSRAVPEIEIIEKILRYEEAARKTSNELMPTSPNFSFVVIKINRNRNVIIRYDIDQSLITRPRLLGAQSYMRKQIYAERSR